MPGRYAGVLGTAGHIDHGKSTLIKALTGTDPDRLKEEKERGITIELGFAELDLPGDLCLGVVDVPGHEKFIRHMVAGATGIDIALLVVAADDGVMVQTREHLTILQLLGVRQLVVALTKTDRAGAELTELAAADVAALLETTPYAGAEVVATSAVTGAGLDELRASLARAARSLPRRSDAAAARLPIDRVFTIGGAGTVVTGTLWEGRIALGDKLELVGSGRELRVRQIQEHGQPVDGASAGQRVALNLVGASKDEIARGMVIATPGALHPTSRLNAHFSYLGDPAHLLPLKSGTMVHLHHASATVLARLLILERKDAADAAAPGDKLELAPGQSGFIQLRLADPMVMRSGDHFIIRAGDPLYSIGGGVVLDSAAALRTRLSAGELALLQALSEGDIPGAVCLVLAQAQTPVTSAQVAQALGRERSEVVALLNQTGEGEVWRIKTSAGAGGQTAYLPAARADQLLSGIEQALLAWHEACPQQASLAVRALQDLMGARLHAELDPEVFDALLQQLADAGKITLEAGKVAHRRAAASVQSQLAELREGILARLEPQGLSPESVADLQAALGAQRSLLGQALGALTKEGLLVRLSGELYFTPAALQRARACLSTALQEAPEGMGAAALRDLLGVSRKYAIPVLEYFDAQGLTTRAGDLRHLK
ncbi:MAG: selenocysteine-specific translation elongation factor [Coriobacteriia bacterium]|nr:selenocysteine-specific translation elongation factor [Coriobacteriia bacterium]